MDVIELIPGLHFLRFPVGHAYLCQDPDGLTLIDTSGPGSAGQIATAIGALGHEPADLRRLLLTHFHPDHAGAAAEIAAWADIEVCAHHADAPFLRGDAPGPSPDLADWERPLFDQVSRQLPRHTPGSIAFYLPGRRVLLAGDTAARSPSGRVMPGVFNTDRARAAASFRRLADLDTDIACFGHGEPLTRDAALQLRTAAGQDG